MRKRRQHASGLTGEETRASLRFLNWSAGFRSVFETVAGGNTFIFTGFARSIGIAREHMGSISFLMSVACVLQMAAIPFINRSRNKKRLALRLATAEPLLVVAGVVLALLLPPPIRVYAFGAAVFAGTAFLHLSQPVTDDWIAATIPEGIRGRYLGRRLQILSATTIVTTLVAGALGQRFGMNNTSGLGALLIASAVCGVLAVRMLRDSTMPGLTANTAPHLRDFVGAFRHPPFVRFLMFRLLFDVPFFLACPYYQVFNLEVAAMPASMIGLMQTIYYAVRMLTLPALGRVIDRWGVRRAMSVASPLYVLFFLSFVFCSSGWYWPIMLTWALIGLSDAIFCLAFQTALYGSVPHAPSRPAFFAIANVLTTASFGLGGLLAVPALQAIRDVQVDLGPMRLGSFHLLYATCALIMIPCATSARFLPGVTARVAPASEGNTNESVAP